MVLDGNNFIQSLVKSFALYCYILCALAVGISACSPWNRLEFVYEPVEASSLVGNWVCDGDKSRGIADPSGLEVELFSNGRSTLKKIPVNEFLVDRMGPTVEGDAKWRVVKGVDGEFQVQFEVRRSGLDFSIMRDRSGEFYLVQMLKQPDDLEKIVLRRQTKAP